MQEFDSPLGYRGKTGGRGIFLDTLSFKKIEVARHPIKRKCATEHMIPVAHSKS